MMDLNKSGSTPYFFALYAIFFVFRNLLEERNFSRRHIAICGWIVVYRYPSQPPTTRDDLLWGMSRDDDRIRIISRMRIIIRRHFRGNKRRNIGSLRELGVPRLIFGKHGTVEGDEPLIRLSGLLDGKRIDHRKLLKKRAPAAAGAHGGIRRCR